MEKKIPLQLFNTLTRKKETFKPINKRVVKIYSCGPTVYSFQHAGNLRTYIFSDILRRVLEFNGYKVRHVINVTDVGHLTSDRDDGEDKMEIAVKKEGKTAREIADFYFKIFKEDLEKLNIFEPDIFPKASEHIKEQIELIKVLERKGYTYKTSDGIYFDSSKFKSYGGMARLNLKGLKKGRRVSFREKRNSHDFALWKFSSPDEKRQQEWGSPWGVGFPGWHLECSAMSMKYLGEHFDIHTGGEDHIPIHHTNEIAQSEAATGKKFVNYWLHGAFLLSKGEKVSKSKGGLYTISELEERGFCPLHFRYLCLMTHYKKPLNFSLENLDAARNAYERMKRRIIELKREKHKGKDSSESYKRKFLDAVNDDLNMPKALDVIWKVIDDFDFSPKRKLKLLEVFDKVLGLGIKEMTQERVAVPESVKKLIRERDRLRKEKKWAEADVIRERVREKGYLIEDTNDGYRIRKG